MFAHSNMQSGFLMGMSHMFHTGNPIIDMVVAMVLASVVGSLAMYQIQWTKWLQDMVDRYLNKEFTAYVVRETRINPSIQMLNSGATKSFCSGTEHIHKGIIKHLKTTEWTSKQSYFNVVPNTKRIENGCISVVVPTESNRLPYHDTWITVPFEDTTVKIKYTYGEKGGSKSSSSEDFGRRTQLVNGGRSEPNEGSDQMLIETFAVRGKNAMLVQRFINHVTMKSMEEEHNLTIAKLTKRRNFVTRGTRGDTVCCDDFSLEDRKSFNTIHFPEKEMIVRVLDQFTTKEGVFARPSRPYRLNMLLHGPPGTGKTSLIKAIANHLGRSIMSVNLSTIDSAAAFQKLMLSGEFLGNQFRSLTQLVIVIEEIDTYVDILKERTEQKKLIYAAPSVVDKSEKPVDLDKLREMIDIGTILEAMDGTIDTPGRVLIMTTNHTDKLKELDEAFLRPGRVDISLHMGFVVPECCVNILKQQYGIEELTAEQQEFFSAFVQKNEVTPAMLESWCIEFETIEALMDELSRR